MPSRFLKQGFKTKLALKKDIKAFSRKSAARTVFLLVLITPPDFPARVGFPCASCISPGRAACLCGGQVLALSAVLLAALLCGAREQGGLLPCPVYSQDHWVQDSHTCVRISLGSWGRAAPTALPAQAVCCSLQAPSEGQEGREGSQRDQRTKGATRSVPHELHEQGAGWWHSAVCPETFLLCCWGTGCACHSG